MEKYPEYVTGYLRPLVFLTGIIDNEPDVHNRMIRVFDTIQKENAQISSSNITSEVPFLSFRSISQDFLVPEKKPPREAPSFDGIVKYNWPIKHTDLIPSVELLFTPFNVDWSAVEWAKREQLLQERYSRLKATLGSRDIRLIIIMVKIGAGSLEKDVLDDRVSAFKRRAQTDSKSFLFISLAELVAENPNIKRLFKTVKESSFSYYSSVIKRLKSGEKAISDKHKGLSENILKARYDFKIAFLNEFQGQSSYSMKYYRQAYNALTNAIETIDEEMYDQVKQVAEIVHFKISRMLFSVGNIEDAFQQFRVHISVFTKLYSSVPWKHYAWVADQYLVFANLLDKINISESIPHGDRSYYYQNAAKFTQKREESFLKIKADVANSIAQFPPREKDSKLFRGMVLVSPKFIGSPMLSYDPSVASSQLDPSQALYLDFIREREYHTDIKKLHLDYLSRGLSAIPLENKRKRAPLLSDLAHYYLRIEDFDNAKKHFWESVQMMCEDGWAFPSLPLLQQLVSCTSLLALPEEYIKAALLIYSNAGYIYYSRHELEELHLNVMSLFAVSLGRLSLTDGKPDEALTEKWYVTNKQSFISTSYLPFFKRPEYGSKAVPESRRFTLPDSFTVSINKECNMFDIEVQFAQLTVELGQRLGIKIKVASHFADTVLFDEIKFYSFENVVIKTFVHSKDESGGSSIVVDTSGAKVSRADLTLHPFKPKTFDFFWDITEEEFSSYVSNQLVFGIDHVEFIWTNKEMGKEIKFDVAAYPIDLFYHIKHGGKMWNCRDLFYFTKQKHSAVVSITRPSKLLQLIKPTQSVMLLEGLLQRVDVMCRVGDYDLQDCKVFLSSDAAPANAGDSLFWCPNIEELPAEYSDPQFLDSVTFHPIKLNASLQPSLPLLVSGLCPAGSDISIPLFIRSTKSGVFTIRLTIEFLPRGIMNSTMSKELTVKLKVKRPLSVAFALLQSDKAYHVCSDGSGDGSGDSSNAVVVVEGGLNIFEVNCECTHTLETAPLEIRQAQVFASSSSASRVRFAETNKSDYAAGGHLLLRWGEELKRLVPFSCATNSSDAEISSLDPGTFSLSWVSHGSHPLTAAHTEKEAAETDIKQRQIVSNKGGFFPLGHAFDWLLYPLPRLSTISSSSPSSSAEEPVAQSEGSGAEDDVDLSQALDLDFACSAVATTVVALPSLKVAKSKFDVRVDAPATAKLGQRFSISLVIRSSSPSLEKLTARVSMSDDFLLAGSSAYALEVVGEERFVLQSLALKSGWLSLPRVWLHWERPDGSSSKIFDLGESESERRVIFIVPDI